MHLYSSSYKDGIALTIAHRVAFFNAIKDNEEPQHMGPWCAHSYEEHISPCSNLTREASLSQIVALLLFP